MTRTRGVFWAIVSVCMLIAGYGLISGKNEPPHPSLIDHTTKRQSLLPGQVLLSIASSNTKKEWLNQVVKKFNDKEKKLSSGKTIKVEVTHVTSGGSRDDILAGGLKPVVWSPGDASWIGSINDAWRLRTGKPLISGNCPSTVYAPIGFAMWRPMAEALGWPDKPIGWDTIVKLAADPKGWASYGHPEWGKFRFGHTHPAYSNSGLLSLITFVYGIIGSKTPLTAAEVYRPEVEKAMRSLEQNTCKYGYQSSALFDLMLSEGPRYLHAIAASEETTLRYNIEHGHDLRFPLAFILPDGGTIWGDHPYCILDNAPWVRSEEVEAAAIFRDFLLAREQQELAIEYRLRPLDVNISLHTPLDLEHGTDPRLTPDLVPSLPSPDDSVSAAVIDLFKITKRKATVIITLDISGSMQGEKIRTATNATVEFLRRLDPDDKVAVLTFNDQVMALSKPNFIHNVVEELSQRVNTLIADGSTALYDAVCQAVELTGKLKEEDEAKGEARLYGIILLSDGDDTVGKPTENRMFTECLPAHAEADGFKIFPIAFGEEANESILSHISAVTGGRMFTAAPGSISDVYFAISAEQ